MSKKEWYLREKQRLEVRLTDKALKGAYRDAVFMSHDADANRVEVVYSSGVPSQAPIPQIRIRPQAPETPDWWLGKLEVGDDVECNVQGDWWPTKLLEMPSAEGRYALRSTNQDRDFLVDASAIRPGWKFNRPKGNWEKMKGEQCFSPSCMTLASSSPLWSIMKKTTTLDDGLSKFSCFGSLKQWLTSHGETLHVELTCERILGTGNMPIPVPVKMEFNFKNIIATTSPGACAKLEPTSFKGAITNEFEIQMFHVDRKGSLAQRRYSSASELDDDLFLGDGVAVTSATEKDRIQIQTPAESAESWLSRDIFAMDVRISHPHVPIFAWSRSLQKLVAVNKVFVGVEDTEDSTFSLVKTEETTANSNEKPNPKDVCEIKWPKLIFRLPYTLESDVVLNETHLREEWLESGFLAKTIETLVAQSGVPNLYATVPAATMRSLKVHWMRWRTPTRVLVVLVHPRGGRASLMGVEMSLGDVHKVQETREWIESPDNTVVHICRPSPSREPTRMLQGKAKIDVATSIIFPDVSYRPDNSFHTRVAYTEMLKASHDGKKLFVQNISLKEPIGDFSLLAPEPSKYSRGRIDLPLFGSGMSASFTKPARRFGGYEDESLSFLTVHSGNTKVQTTVEIDIVNSHVDVDEESKMLLVGRELSWLSCLCCKLNPSRWFDEAEHAALHALVEPYGGFIGRISMKRFCLRSLGHNENVWWVVYPRTAVTVGSGDAARCVFGDAAFPNEPLEQVYIKMLQSARTEALIQTLFDKILGRDKDDVSPDVVAFQGRGGLARAAKYASSRGSEKTSNLLVAVALTVEEQDAHKARLDAKYRACELAMKRERVHARRDHPELCDKFHADKEIARKRVGIDGGDPIVKYKSAMKAYLDVKAKKEQDEEFGHEGGRLFHDLGLCTRHLCVSVIFNDFKTKQ